MPEISRAAPTFYLMVGIPGSGKSTYCKNCLGLSTIVSTDAIRGELYGNEEIQGDGKIVFQIAHKRIEEYLKCGSDVAFDATNIRKKHRKDILNKLPAGTNAVAVYMDTPLGECLKRNQARERKVPDHVIRRMSANIEPPMTDEGFVRVVRIGEEAVV